MKLIENIFLSVMYCLISVHYIFLRIINFFQKFYFKVTKPKRQKSLFPINHEILLQPAVDLAEKIMRKQITSEKVVTHFIERIVEIDKHINAVAGVNFNQAIHDAKLIDQMVLEKSEKELKENFPFLGVPFSVKSCIEIKDFPFSAGALERSQIKGTRDAEVVTLLKAAGAIPICVTNTPVLCMSWECYNPVNGPTRNPYDLNRTSGGSSGGEAALIASGGSIIGIGSDFGGSIRIPAAFCGVFGHKPTRDLISCDGLFPTLSDELFRSFLVFGPITRYSKDLAPMLSILSRKHPKLKLNEPITISDIKIYYMNELRGNFIERLKILPTSKDVDDCVSKATNFFINKGCVVEKAPIDTSKLINILTILVLDCQPPDLMSCMKDKSNEKDNVWFELLKTVFGNSNYTLTPLILAALSKTRCMIPESIFIDNRKKFDNIKDEFSKLLNENEVLILPTFPTPAFHTYGSLPNWGGLIYTIVFNALGFPATHVPMGLNKDGLPVGVQVVADMYQDRLCLAVARFLEDEFGGWVGE